MDNTQPRPRAHARREQFKAILRDIWDEWCRDQERLYLMQFPSYDPTFFKGEKR